MLQLAAQRAQQLRQAPLDRAFVALMLPYGPETVPEGKTTADARLALETKRFYWQGVRRTLDAEYSRRRAALIRRLTKKARRLNAPLHVADASLGRERSAVRLVVEDIDLDLANLGPAGPKDGAKLLERKAELFRTLALLKN